jgi:hypothetical protein
MKRNSLRLLLSLGCILTILSASSIAQSFTFTAIDVPGAVFTAAEGISPGGAIAGFYTDSAGTHGFVLSNGVFSPPINYPGAISTDARGISPTGAVVGTFKNSLTDVSQWHGYVLSHGVFTEVQAPGYMGSIAQRITPTGHIYGCVHDTDFGANMRGFVRSLSGHYSVFDVPSSMHNGATPAGNTIAGLYNDMTTGVRYGYILANGTFMTFLVPGSLSTEGWDMSPQGNVVGDFTDSSGLHGFLRTADGTYTKIDFPGATATAARGINPGGDIVGWYVDSNNKTHGFLAVPTAAE